MGDIFFLLCLDSCKDSNGEKKMLGHRWPGLQSSLEGCMQEVGRGFRAGLEGHAVRAARVVVCS